MRVYRRDERRTVHDDFVLNVQPYMDPSEGAELRDDLWIVEPLYE